MTAGEIIKIMGVLGGYTGRLKFKLEEIKLRDDEFLQEMIEKDLEEINECIEVLRREFNR